MPLLLSKKSRSVTAKPNCLGLLKRQLVVLKIACPAAIIEINRKKIVRTDAVNFPKQLFLIFLKFCVLDEKESKVIALAVLTL
jgi:hypothetical protein